MPVVMSSLFETGFGLAAAVACAAALPDVRRVARRGAGPRAGDVRACSSTTCCSSPLVLADGRIRAPFDEASGGLGVVVDEAAVDRYAVDDA